MKDFVNCIRVCCVASLPRVPLCRGAEEDMAGHTPRVPHLADHTATFEQVSAQACATEGLKNRLTLGNGNVCAAG